ncbi:response regulator transcription factor [Azospirillum agricola]|uniref:response regulator transcription factor n=1 Tax=Azospirillum agricola TaxID=1720247 RepID=UPI000A0F282B|nr:response regulator transcription factor [Azospirillum agricola]SMH40016.1 DNA-binding response regulator, OmpR family, contains REC and winged-helix (wHTH) domain [Azospirillum lipoferum]
MRVLVVEDDAAVSYWIGAKLNGSGHACRFAGDGEGALRLLAEEAFDVVVLDRMLPKLDGMEVLKRLHGTRHPPVLVLSALDETSDRVAGLRAGADDYLGKPFDFAELLVRLEHLARRHGRAAAPGDVLTVSDLVMDVPERRVTRRGVPIELTDKEFKLLHILMSNPGQTVTRNMLLEKAWGYGFNPQTNLVEVHVFKLRGKIDKDFDPPLLRTIRAIGYALG